LNLVWFRNDLRINDNPALSAADDESLPLAAVYLVCSEQTEGYGIGLNQQAYLYQSLQQLHKELAKKNIPLFIIEGSTFKSAPELIKNLCQTLEVKKLYFNLEYPIDERTRDKNVVDIVSETVQCCRYIGDSLVAPWQVVNGSGGGYKVFTPFSRAHANILSDMPVELTSEVKSRQPENLKVIQQILTKNILEHADFTGSNSGTEKDLFDSTKQWLSNCNPNKMTPIEIPTSQHSQITSQMRSFCEDKINDYSEQRDFPIIDATSKISSALAMGCISANECYLIARQGNKEKAAAWTRQLVWRDFYRSVMWHYPHVCKGQAFLEVDKAIRWSKDLVALDKFKQGRTGVPIVDAAVKQLVKTGWMHNRLRMVVASYFCKNLWLDWRIGESFFAEHLFDYDFANNNGGWQWSASVGTDASPYFRVFNPQSQQKKFDKEGKFIKSWIEPLEQTEAKKIHQFETTSILDYPELQVDLKTSRKQAIETFKNAKQSLQLMQSE
jgi:deoxyribodipyrimidine photo-lyase